MIMKILIAMDNPLLPTGYGSTCRLTGKELTKRGHSIFAMAFNGGTQKGAKGEDIFDYYNLKIVSNFALDRDSNAIYGDAECMKKAYDLVKPDVILWHNDSYRYSYIERLPKEMMERSIFWLPYEADYPDPLGPKTFGKCAAVRFVTNHAMAANMSVVKDVDHAVIPHSIDMEHIRPSPDKRNAKASKQLGIEDKFVVVRVDRHQPRKYWDSTIKAFAKFAKDKDDVFLLGKCNPKDITMWNESKKEGIDLVALADSLGLKGKYFFDDYFFDTSYMGPAFYWPADVFLTTTSGEGFGLCAAEAMAAGIPVIYPDTPVLPEVVGLGGLMCKRIGREWYSKMNVYHNLVDIDDVAAKLESCYADWKSGGKELAATGLRARQIAEEKYSPKVVYDKFDELIKDVGERRDLVSLITVLYNVSGAPQIHDEDGVERLRVTLEANVKHPYEWIIVDNGSPARAETREWMANAAKLNPRIKPLYLDTNLGFNGGNNAAMVASKGKWVILMNPDCEAIPPQKHGLEHDFVRIYLDRFKSDPSIGVAGMKLMRRDDVMPGAMFPYFCCTMISDECLKAIELSPGEYLDHKFWPAYYEDCDLCIRAQAKGFKVVEQDVPFWHKSGGTNKHAVKDGAAGKVPKYLLGAMDTIQREGKLQMDFDRKRGELIAHGMQGVIAGNIAELNRKWGVSARSKIRVVWDTNIGYGVGFSAICEGLAPELHRLGFDVYINDWYNGQNVEDPLVRELIEKTRKARESGDDLSDAIHIVCWLMESFMDVRATFKVGISLCESTKVRESYLGACNSMDAILTFSEFCRGVQKNSGYDVPINVINPGVEKSFINLVHRPKTDKFRFLTVGVCQGRKDTHRLVEAFCEAFPKGRKVPPDCGENFPYSCDDVELVVKSNNFGELDWIANGGFDKRANVRAIFTGPSEKASRANYTTQEMFDLYASCNCLVHPSHGEGIGMPILEAAATGMPVIFTNWSSPVEYLGQAESYPCDLSPYPGTTFTKAYEGAPGDNGVWANIHVGHMKFLMQHVIRNWPEAAAKGEKAHKKIADNYNWEVSARQLMPLLFEWESQRKKKVPSEEFNPATFKKPALEPVAKGDRVMIDVVTRDRHPYIGMLLVSLLGQTFKDWDLIIEVDDADESILKNPWIMALTQRLQHEGHGWNLIRSHRQGPHIAHDRTLQMTAGREYKVKVDGQDVTRKYKLICRIDDDIYVRPEYLEKMFSEFEKDKDCQLAACGGVYLDPRRSEAEQMAPKGFESDINYAGSIDHNVMWPYVCVYPPGTSPRVVEHLHSSFMHRVEIGIAIGGYCKLYSQIGHREESDFSYRFHMAGYRQVVHPEAVGFHFRAPSGGIRSMDIPEKERLAMGDHKIYENRLREWKDKASRKGTADATLPKPTGYEKPKVLAVINGKGDAKSIDEAIKYFKGMSDSVYVTCPSHVSLSEEATMVARTPDEVVALTRAMLSEGDHEYILSVTDTMRFSRDPRSVITDRCDDYVFEVFKTYVPGRWNGFVYVGDEAIGQVIGPELRNQCLLTRRRPKAAPTMDKIMFSDIMVVDDERLSPIDGKSIMSNELLVVSELGNRSWRKVCTYQFPEGQLREPRHMDVHNNPKNLVSIIIPTPGRRDLLKRCIDTIYTHTKTSFELIIIDNNSSDGTKEMLEAEAKMRPNLFVYRQPVNLGYQKSINVAISKSKGNYILLFNDDAWIESEEPDGRDWLQTYIDELDADQTLGIIGPHGCDSPALGNRILFFWCVMFKKSLYDKIGPLDDVTFFNYGGDDDYCERAKQAGYKIKEKYLHLRHLMTCVPEAVKRPELIESETKLRTKYGKRK